MDALGGVRLGDGSEAKIVTGIDDHSRFCVSALVVARATARPTCDALALALRKHGAPAQILTDNGKVFTNRFGGGTGEVLQDLRSIDDAQVKLDTWVHTYNHERPHQSLGMGVPWDRFALAKPAPIEHVAPVVVDAEPAAMPTVTRRVGRNGLISFAAAPYRAGVWLAGENVTVVCDGGLVHLHHRGVLIATHARRHRVDKQSAGVRRGVRRPKPPRPTATAASVTRKVDGSGNVCFAGTNYRATPPPILAST
jgi:hypothetical protein